MLSQGPELFEEFARQFDGVIRVESVDGRVVYAGPGLPELTGTDSGSEDDVVWELTHPDDRDRVRTLLRDEPGPYDIEYRILHPEGGVRWIRHRGFPVPRNGSSPPRIVGVLEDVTERRRERKRLEETAVLLTQTFASLDEAVILIEPDDEGRTIRDVNPSAERMFGYSRGELVGASTEKLHVSQEAFELFGKEGLSILAEEGIFRGTYPLRRKDGNVFAAEQTVTLLRPEKGLTGGAVSMVRDVSEQVEAEARLRESEGRFRLIAEGITAVVWIRTVEPESAMEYVSPAYQKIWGRSPEELYEDPKAWLNHILPGDRDRVRLAFAEDHESYDEEYRILRPDGEVRWIWDRAFPGLPAGGGKGRRIIGLAEDITERKQAEQRFVVLSREITDVIYVVEPDATIRFASPSVEQVLEYPMEEFEGKNVLDLVHPEDRVRVRDEIIRKIVHQPGASSSDRYRMMTRNGEARHVDAVAHNRLDHPAIEGLVVTARDVTERLELEERLRQSQKMEAVGRLAGGIAHDFNNLLTVIRAESDLLLLDLGDSEEFSSELRMIQESADRAAKLTSQLLAFSRDQILRPQPVAVDAVVRGMGSLLDRVIGEDVAILYDLPQILPSVKVDPGQLEQVILNLAVNARDAMPDGGSLTFSAFEEELTEQEAEEDPEMEAGRYVVLEIADTGSGMDEETQARIFEPFFTTKEESHGTGLGLAMVYGFVAQSGGTIRVKSAPGQGATFLLRFPVVDRLPADLPPAASVSAVEERLSGRILVVEDDHAVRRVTERILVRAGMEVLAVQTAERALEVMEAGEEVDLVLTDLVLPGMSGRLLVDELRAKRPGLGLIVVSGYAADSPGQRGDLPAEVAFLQKPYTPQKLIDTVSRKRAERF